MTAEQPPAGPCVYYERPGHTLEQKPDPRTAYANGPDGLPLCSRCAAAVNAEQPGGATPAAVDYARSPMLHQNGRGLEHEAAFRAAAEDDQARHLKRQHMLADVDGARRTATDPGKPLASLSEAHEWWHIRQRRHD